VETAKKRPTRFALGASDSRAVYASDAQAFVDLLLSLRAKRSKEGWEVFDLLVSGTSQKSVAQSLGISEQAVSLRARAAQVSVELDAVPALVRALGRVDQPVERSR
jgi:FixJ family two-component response regulator